MVDEFQVLLLLRPAEMYLLQNTAVPGVYALGDVCGQVELTPGSCLPLWMVRGCMTFSFSVVAIKAGRALAHRLFDGQQDSKMGAPLLHLPTLHDKLVRVDYDDVPSAVFSHPPIGCVGLSEQAAVNKVSILS